LISLIQHIIRVVLQLQVIDILLQTRDLNIF